MKTIGRKRGWKLDDLDAGRPFDELHFIPVRGIDKDESTTRGAVRRAVGDPDALAVQCGDRLVEIIDLEGKMHEVLLNLDGTAGRKAAEFDQFFAVRHAQERQVRASRRGMTLHHLQPQYLGVEGNGLVHVADSHAGVQEFFNLHGAHYELSAVGIRVWKLTAMLFSLVPALTFSATKSRRCPGSRSSASGRFPGTPASCRMHARRY